MKNCENCGKEYHPKNGGSKYCPDCVKIKQTCPVCGTVFTTYRADLRVVCSQRCGYAYQLGNHKPYKVRIDEPMIPEIIASDLYNGKTLERIAERNEWDIKELVLFIHKNKKRINRQIEICRLNNYPKAINTEHRNAYVSRVHQPALL